MRDNEIKPPKLFLCSDLPQKVGAIVVPDIEGGLLPADLEEVLEAERPTGRLKRSETIDLVSVPTRAEYVYRVTLVGALECQHSGWLRMLIDSDPLQLGVRSSIANGYWSNEVCSMFSKAPWEYRSSSAKILTRIGSI